MERQEVSLKKEDGVALLRIERPKRLNALSRDIVKQIGELLEEIEVDEETRVLLIHSEKHFAAGADIQDMAECNEQEAAEFVFSPVFDRIESLPIPTVAAIEGYALGGGLELALACDIRFASEKAKLGFPEINLGIMPGAGGTVRTPKIAGAAAAMELIFSGEIINAKRALELGLVNRLVPNEELLETAQEFALNLAKKAPVALRTAKNTIQEGLAMANEGEAVHNESKKWASLFNTEDQKEGMKAFLEKRTPIYKGR